MNQSEANEEASNLIPNLHPPTSSPGLSPKKVGWRPTHFLREKPWGRGYPPSTPSQPLWDVNEEQRISRGKGKWKKKWKRTKAWFLAGKVLLKSVVKNLWGMVWRISLLKSSRQLLNVKVSLRSRCLEVVGTRKNGRARKRHACLPRAPVFSFTHYFQAPATQATLRCSLHIYSCLLSSLIIHSKYFPDSDWLQALA